jgi:hypothetical protein
MVLKNSATGQVCRSHFIDELKDAARLIRGYDLVALNAAGGAHAGGTHLVDRSQGSQPLSRLGLRGLLSAERPLGGDR